MALTMLGAGGVNAADTQHEGHVTGQKGIPAVIVTSAQEGVCATCRFWGGIRRVTEDKKNVYCESLGWCSNPDSMHYQMMTTPMTGPMKSWQKWEAI